jgi:exosortase/archaeosortase family protein
MKIKLFEFLKEIPLEIRQFLIRACIIFLLWKFCYYLILKPTRVVDKPLTVQTTKSTLLVLKSFYTNATFSIVEKIPTNKIDFYSLVIIKDGRKVLGIADPCNALELFVLFSSFLLCIPLNWKRILLFSIGGTAIIYFFNILRCSFIGYLNISNSSYIDIAHHYIFKLIMYLIIFGGWVWYLKGKTVKNE